MPNRYLNKILIFVLSTFLIISSILPVYALDVKSLDLAIGETAEYLYKTVKNPQVGSVGGEWTILGLARSSYDIPEEYYQNYYKTVEEYIKACDGNLHSKKYTEYSRPIVALTSIGKDPSDVAGYNLFIPIADYDKTVWQGLNGPIWALLAFDSGDYDIPINTSADTQATRDMYINYILECQLPDGGWSLLGGTSASSGDNTSDPDITGMALQSLAKYQEREDVKESINEALSCLSKMQNNNGGYESGNNSNAESNSQVIAALSELGIPLDDPRFIKNGRTVIDDLMSYYIKGNGFKHTQDSNSSNLMATEQSFYGMIAAKRVFDGKNSLYRMSDNIKFLKVEKGEINKVGLENKSPDVNVTIVKHLDKTFSDISSHKNQAEIEALASREIINGKTETKFEPNSTMTRAEFATIIVNGLGFHLKGENVFSDVFENDWFYKYVNTAYNYEIVTGISETIFNPNGTITREEASVMIARAAKLCGMDTAIKTIGIRDILAGFTDYVKASDWAMPSLAFCYRENILSNDDIEILPKSEITRAEIAQMLFNMLRIAKLL